MVNQGQRIEASRFKRAPRFNRQIPLRYRIPGEPRWHVGTTENISLSGVLFRGLHPLQSNSPIQLSFVVHSKLSAKAIGVIICDGHVVRTEPPSRGASAMGFAAKISDRHFLPA